MKRVYVLLVLIFILTSCSYQNEYISKEMEVSCMVYQEKVNDYDINKTIINCRIHQCQ